MAGIFTDLLTFDLRLSDLPIHDLPIATKWSDLLGLSDWFSCTDFENVPIDYMDSL